MLFLSFISEGDGEVGRGLIWKANNHILGDGELEMQGNLQMARKHGVKARTEKPQTVPGSGCNSRRRRKEGDAMATRSGPRMRRRESDRPRPGSAGLVPNAGGSTDSYTSVASICPET